jgi:hypothetical protein
MASVRSVKEHFIFRKIDKTQGVVLLPTKGVISPRIFKGVPFVTIYLA